MTVATTLTPDQTSILEQTWDEAIAADAKVVNKAFYEKVRGHSGLGDYNLVASWLRDKRRAVQAAERGDIAVPADIVDDLQPLWQKAVLAATAELEARHTAELDRLTKEAGDAVAAQTRAETKQVEAETSLAKAQAELAAIKDTVTDLRNAAKGHQAAMDAQQKAQDTAQRVAQVATAERAEALATADAARAELSKAEKVLVTVKFETEVLREQLATARDAAADSDTRTALAEQRATTIETDLTAQLATLRGEVDNLTGALASARDAAVQNDKRAALAEQRAAAVEADLTGALTTLREEVGTLTAAHREIRDQLTGTTLELTAARTEATTLRVLLDRIEPAPLADPNDAGRSETDRRH